MENQNQPKRSFTTVLFILAIMITLGGLVLWKMNQPKPGAPPPGAGPKATTQKVTGYITRNQNIPISLESSGTLLAWNEVQLMSETAGRITQLSISEGSHVLEGQLLVGLFDEDLRAQEKKQELQAEITKKNLARLRDLLKINGVSQQEFENAENQLNNIQSDLLLIRANLKKTRILAPFSGTIGLTNASLGGFLSPGNPIASLQQTDVLKLEFSIPEKYARLLQSGDKVFFTTESAPAQLQAVVYAFEPRIDPATRTLTVRARFENQSARLLPGAFAKATVRLREIQNAILIPTQSIIPETRGKKVVLYRNGKAEFVPVETGIRNQDKIQITKGLSTGDTVLTTGLMFAKPGGDLLLTRIQN